MRKILLAACCCVFLSAGCASTSQETAMVGGEEMSEHAAAPQENVTASKTETHKGKEVLVAQAKHPMNEAQIKADLDATAHTLLQRAARTITPSKANKAVSKVGNEYVARYVFIDPTKYSTEMRPATKKGTYNGFIRYSEQVFQCKGNSKSAALSAPCNPVSSKRMNVMVHFDGAKWNYQA